MSFRVIDEADAEKYQATYRVCSIEADTRRAQIADAMASSSQSYANCSVESCRVIINQFLRTKGKPPITEKAALVNALGRGLAVYRRNEGQMNPSATRVGGQTAEMALELLRVYGVKAIALRTDETLSDFNGRVQKWQQVKDALIARKGVIMACTARTLWEIDTIGEHASHAIVPFDQTAREHVICFDSARSLCAVAYAVPTLLNSTIVRVPLIVTTERIW